MRTKKKAIAYAVLAAVFYAINTPCSKILLKYVPATFMAGFLYLGAGLGIGILYIFKHKKETASERLSKSDAPYAIGMILLDILAPIFLMIGIKYATASNAALLGNFEIVATALIALMIFKESVSKWLWVAICAIVIASACLSVEQSDGFNFSYGSIFVLLAASCWGLENNCTRKISEKSTYEIVTLKGLCSGGGSIIIAYVLREQLPDIKYILLTMLLGFVAYGLSIFTYIRAQRTLGAAKTSAYYAIAPFIGSFLAFLLLGEKMKINYLIGLVFMIIGSVIVVMDTLVKHHVHEHTHTITYKRDGVIHVHTIVHSHGHNHYRSEDNHTHHHSKKRLKMEQSKNMKMSG
ncbi:MAG: DMT family transporter [Acutalibacteraceae bacterium]